jgi:glycosyltransferase involved in cell wall biosynthesis
MKSDGKMRILEVVSALSPMGGSETFAVNFACSINEESELLMVILHSNMNEILVSRLKKGNVRFIVLDKKGHFDFKTIVKLKKIINDFKPDVIHTENNALITTALATFGSRRIPIFHTVHLLAQYEVGNSQIMKRLYKHYFRTEKAIPIAISKEVQKSIIDEYKLSYAVPCIFNGIEIERFRNDNRLENRRYDCTVIGRFEEVKNHDYIIKLFEKTHGSFPDAKFALAGDGSLFDLYGKYLKDNHLDYIEMLGVIEDIPGLLAQTKILLLCSKHEANPLSLLEGLASGCVIIASRVGGIPSVISDGENGFLYDLDQFESFASKIASVISNPQVFEPMSKRNVEYSKKFSIATMTKEYLTLFQKSI